MDGKTKGLLAAVLRESSKPSPYFRTESRPIPLPNRASMTEDARKALENSRRRLNGNIQRGRDKAAER